MSLVQSMVASGRVAWFVRNVINAHRTDENEHLLWDMWLHKVWDNTNFDDYKKQAVNRARNSAKNEYIRSHPEEIAKTVEKSRGIMQMFNGVRVESRL